MEIWILARLLALGAGQVKENWFEVSFMFHDSCQTLLQPGASVNPQPGGNTPINHAAQRQGIA
jgi:hypothetical protein